MMEGSRSGGVRLRQPTLTEVLLFVLLAASAFPFRFHVTATQTASVFDAALVGVAVILAFSRPWRNGFRLPKPYLLFAGLSLSLGLLSFLWTESAKSTVDFVISTAEGIVAFGIVILLLRGRTERFVVYAICSWIGLFTLGSLLMYAHVPGFAPAGNLDPSSGNYISFFTRFSHPLLGRSNNIAAIFVAFVPALALWAMIRRDKVAAGFAIGTTVLLIATGSRGALIGLIVASVAWLIIDRRARRLGRRIVFWLVGIAVVSAVVVTVNGNVRALLVDRLFSARNVTARGSLLGDAWNAISQNPWLGVGGGAGADVHNTFVQQFVYFGLIGGTILAAALIWTVAFWFLPKRGTPAKWIYIAAGIGIAAQVISFLFEASLEGALLRPLIWMTWGLLYALAQAGSTKSQLDDVDDEPGRFSTRV